MLNKEKFKNPDSEYRTAPFWALNDHLDAKELKRQINLFYEQGIGGAFLHPRGGMSTEYLSDDYFSAIKSCIDELERLGMIAWLYDEDKFPSGTAGGKVVEANNDFAQKYIVSEVVDAHDFVQNENTLNTFPFGESKLLHIYLVQADKQKRFNSRSYVDVCSKEAIDTFISLTHQAYYDRFQQHFGKTIKAIFTDEPHFNNQAKGGLPWTKDFDVKFRTQYGYDILERLSDLFFDAPGCEQTRFHYWDLISSLFVESFSKNIYDWCADKGIAYTGHFWEHVFPSPTHNGSVMPHYEYMQYPGIDMLFVSDPGSPEMYGNDLNVKEVSSVANQLGKKRVLSETYGASGWGLSFEHQKRAADWQLALGINLFSQHLSLYSMTGYRKRDFPQSFMDHQPWWDEYKILGDYIGRVSYALSQGAYQANVLVLHPSSSTWSSYGSLSENKDLSKIECSVKSVVKNLNQLQVMFDLGDDIILSKHAKVCGGSLQVGKMNYSTVIMPDMYLMRKEVFTLLKAFMAGGGRLIATGAVPGLLDGTSSDELKAFFQNPDIIHIQNEKSAFSGLLYQSDIKRLKLREQNGKDISEIYAHIRAENNCETIFICNLDMKQKTDLSVSFDKPYYIELFDSESGKTSLCHIDRDSQNGDFCINLSLDALNSALLYVDRDQLTSPAAAESPLEQINLFSDIPQWTVKTLDPNALNLQFCRVSLDNGPYGKIGDVLEIDDRSKEKLSMETGSIFARQPWMYSEDEKNDTHTIKAEYPFFIHSLPSGNVQAAVELPDRFSVFINDIKVSPKDGFYKDRAFVLYEIKEYLHIGENILRIESDQYGVLINLESTYILGDFRLIETERGFEISEEEKLHTGDIVKQGYPYYSGKISYTAQVTLDGDNLDHTVFSFGEFDGTTATVRVNGEKVCVRGWRPYCTDLSGVLKPGKNTIELEISNSLQNLLGPFDKNANLNICTPGSFYTGKHDQFLPFGFSGKT